MGVILCEFHGRAGISLVCPHIRESVNSSLSIHEWFELKELLNLTNNSNDILVNYFCLSCAEKYKLSHITHVLSDIEIDDYEEIIGEVMEPVCGECLCKAKIS